MRRLLAPLRKHDEEIGPGTRLMISAAARLGWKLEPADPWIESQAFIIDDMARRIVDLEEKLKTAKAGGD